MLREPTRYYDVKLITIILKINPAVRTDRTESQWIDLGIHTEACMTRPETCGVAGGSLSFWMKLRNCPEELGVITTIHSGTGLMVLCNAGYTR